jgi:hypothetical protein
MESPRASAAKNRPEISKKHVRITGERLRADLLSPK